MARQKNRRPRRRNRHRQAPVAAMIQTSVDGKPVLSELRGTLSNDGAQVVTPGGVRWVL